MGCIKSIYIKGYKKFQEITVNFNKCMNILVGENEAGKSTILEAIKIVLSQMYKNSDKAILKDLFNKTQIENFKENPSIETLPKIEIELDLILEPMCKNAEYFYGENNRTETESFGIKFECSFNEELGANLVEIINSGEIPYEYYNLSWMTYAKQPYYLIKRPLNFIFIDTSVNDTNSSFNYFNRTLFNNSYGDVERMDYKNKFRTGLNKMFKSIELADIDEHRKFGINDKKIILESVLSVYEDSIALENKGSGMSSLVKTQIALTKAKNNSDVILIEEPENHLSHTTLQKMLFEIEQRQTDTQIIITTHNNLIASRLNLKNVIWIKDNEASPLNNIPDEEAKFFIKSDNNNFLQLLLAQKSVLVEGATEYLLFPSIYKQCTGKTVEEDNISIISCNGISYNRYLDIVKDTNKKILVLTDNDKNTTKIRRAKDYNSKNKFQHIYMDDNVDNWTWEQCFYSLNSEELNNIIQINDDADYLFNGDNYGKVLGKMLNNKVDTAYKMLTSEVSFNIPQYIQDAIKWLSE